MIEHANPFNQSYLTESITSPSELLAHYSFAPMKYVHTEVARETNVFLLGRKGVGKTMVLKLFDADLTAEIFEGSQRYRGVRKLMPRSAVGVYLNLASPMVRVRSFAGRGHPPHWWRAAFADYLNYLLLSHLLKNLETLTSNESWCEACGWGAGTFSAATELVSTVLAALRDESAEFDDVTTYEELKRFVRQRLRAWTRFLNRDVEFPPARWLSFCMPLFRIAEVLRDEHPKLRLLLLVDQYETLHSYHHTVDLRPIFNRAMYEASRGGTGLELKLGCRPYAQGDLKLPEGLGAIETGREVSTVDLDSLAPKYFEPFMAELFAKRLLEANLIAARPKKPKELANEYLPGLGPIEEAGLYVRNAHLESSRHLAPFADEWKRHGIHEDAVVRVFDESGMSDCDVLVAVLTGIAITKWLRKRRRTSPPLRGMEKVEGRLDEQISAYAPRVLNAIATRYKTGTTTARKAGGTARSADDHVRAYEQTALFRIASSYKNQRKVHAGFESLVAISSNVALAFIEIMKTAWDLVMLKPGTRRIKAIPPRLQSRAVYSVSESWFRRISREYDFGDRQTRFLRSLGSAFRAIQLDIGSPVSAPNGFSIVDAALPSEELSPDESAAALLISLVNWGLLEEALHQDKTSGRPKRRKLYINRILCPYLGLTEKRLRDPIYVKDLDSFMDALLTEGGTPPEELRKRAGAPSRTRAGQRGLFE